MHKNDDISISNKICFLVSLTEKNILSCIIQDKLFLNLVMVFHIQHLIIHGYNDSKNSIVSIKSLINKKSDESKVLLRVYRVNVTNTGDVVLAYVTPPMKSLFGFERNQISIRIQMTYRLV